MFSATVIAYNNLTAAIILSSFDMDLSLDIFLFVFGYNSRLIDAITTLKNHPESIFDCKEHNFTNFTLMKLKMTQYFACFG